MRRHFVHQYLSLFTLTAPLTMTPPSHWTPWWIHVMAVFVPWKDLPLKRYNSQMIPHFTLFCLNTDYVKTFHLLSLSNLIWSDLSVTCSLSLSPVLWPSGARHRSPPPCHRGMGAATCIQIIIHPHKSWQKGNKNKKVNQENFTSCKWPQTPLLRAPPGRAARPSSPRCRKAAWTICSFVIHVQILNLNSYQKMRNGSMTDSNAMKKA